MSTSKPMPEDFVVHTIRRVGEMNTLAEVPGSEGMRIDADRYGNIIFKRDTVPEAKVQEGLAGCFGVARKLVDQTKVVTPDYHVESIKLKLTLDGDVGVAFIADAGLEASIEVEIKRQSQGDSKVPAGDAS